LFAILARFKIYILKAEEPAPFPEDELRQERNITEADDLAPENKLEKLLFWGSTDGRSTLYFGATCPVKG
jgi:hypothetical protein